MAWRVRTYTIYEECMLSIFCAQLVWIEAQWQAEGGLVARACHHNGASAK